MTNSNTTSTEFQAAVLELRHISLVLIVKKMVTTGAYYKFGLYHSQKKSQIFTRSARQCFFYFCHDNISKLSTNL